MDVPSENQIEKMLSEKDEEEHGDYKDFVVRLQKITGKNSYRESVDYLLHLLDGNKTKEIKAQPWEMVGGALTAVKIDGDIYRREREQNDMNTKSMDFLEYDTPEELYEVTGLTPEQAIQIVEDRLKKDSPIDEITITCPYCGSTNLKKSGFYRGNKQRYICKKCFKSIMYPTYPKDTELCPYCKDGSIRKDGVSTIGGKQRQRKFCNVCYGTFYVPLETVDNDIEEQQLSDENDNTSTENKEKMKQFGGVRIPELSDVSIIAMKSEGGMKQCSKCKQWKNKTEFSKQRDKKDGVRSYCRECDKNYQKQYKEKMLGKEGENNNDEEV